MKTILLAAAALSLAASASGPALADACDDKVKGLQTDWAHVNYEVAKASRTNEMLALAGRADGVVAQCRGRAEPLVWDAIITASAAGLKGGLGALGLAKEAKGMLEQAEKINPNALDGSVYTSLGSLYYQVPGSPVGFGDKAKARAYLQKALQANPTGIDPNYFMGDFLLHQRDYDGAVRYFEKALAAPGRPGRESADRGRRGEIQPLLAEARKKAS